MSMIVIDRNTISRAANLVFQSQSAIGSVKHSTDTLQGACGDDHLEDRIHDFEDSWNYNRDKLEAFLDSLRANLANLNAEFLALESRLENLLRQQLAASEKPPVKHVPPKKAQPTPRPVRTPPKPGHPAPTGHPSSAGGPAAGAGDPALVAAEPSQRELAQDWDQLLHEHETRRSGFEQEAAEIAIHHNQELDRLQNALQAASPEQRAGIAAEMVAVDRSTQQQLAQLQGDAHELEQGFRRDAREIAHELDGMQWIAPEKAVPVPPLQPVSGAIGAVGADTPAPFVPVARPRGEGTVNLWVGR